MDIYQFNVSMNLFQFFYQLGLLKRTWLLMWIYNYHSASSTCMEKNEFLKNLIDVSTYWFSFWFFTFCVTVVSYHILLRIVYTFHRQWMFVSTFAKKEKSILKINFMQFNEQEVQWETRVSLNLYWTSNESKTQLNYLKEKGKIGILFIPSEFDELVNHWKGFYGQVMRKYTHA